MTDIGSGETRLGPTATRHDIAGQAVRPPGRTRAMDSLRVALMGPPAMAAGSSWPDGVQRVVAQLAGALVRRGHDVALLVPAHARAHDMGTHQIEDEAGRRVGEVVLDALRLRRALAEIEIARRRGRSFDVIHDHSGLALLAVADRIDVPVLHTVHDPFTAATANLYRLYADPTRVSLLSYSQLAAAPPGFRHARVIPNPVDVRTWPLERGKERYLLWTGSFSPEQGAHRAITVARAVDWPLVLAGEIAPEQQAFFDSAVAPHVDDVNVRWVQKVDGRRKQDLFAHAGALLGPLRCPDPFPMTMVEAMACGTPVIAFVDGAAGELVTDGVSGFLVDDEAAMAAAVSRLGEIDPERCRATVADRYDVDVVIDAYENVYRKLIVGGAMAGGRAQSL